MDRKEKRSLSRRLLTIYVCYFIILGAGFMHSFVPMFSSAFAEGWNRAAQDMELERRGIDRGSMLFTVKPRPFSGKWLDIASQSEHLGMRADIEEAIVDITVADMSAADAETVRLLTRSYRMTTYIEFAVMFAWLAILILIGCIINSLRKSIRDERPLSDRNIAYTRAIGILIIAAELLSALELHIGHRTVESLVPADSMLGTGAAFPIEYGNIVLGLLVLFSAEVFAIGTRLSEEQEYTI